MTEIVYGQSWHPLCEGRMFRNPRFFAGPVGGATKVFLIGDWPSIAEAYLRNGVEVVLLAGPEPRRHPLLAPPGLTPSLPDDERDAIYIPADWRDLPWTRPAKDRDLTLRGLAAMFCDAPVLNKAQAVEAIEGELRRRDGAGE